MRELIYWIITFTPKNGFISDILVVEGAIIAIALPLSLEIISRVSERYQSGVITKKFNQRWEVQILLNLLIVDIIISVILKFFSQNDSIEGLWKFFAWLIFIIFLITAVALYSFFQTLIRFIIDTNFLLEELLKDIQETLSLTTYKRKSGMKTLIRKQRKLVESLEGIGDILVFDTKNKKRNIDIEKSLNKIVDKIDQIIDIQKNRPEDFEILLQSEEYSKTQNQSRFKTQLLELDLQKYPISFTTSINQLQRVHEASLEVSNYRIAYMAIHHIISMVVNLCKIPNNIPLVEQVLKSLADIRRNSDGKQHDSILYYVSVGWYTNIVFKNDFILSYQELLDTHFLYGIQYLISEGKNRTFEIMVSGLIDNILISPEYNINVNRDLHGYLKIGNDSITSEILKFDKITRYVRRINQLNECLKTFDNIEKLIEPYSDPDFKNQFQETGNITRKSLISQFKYNNLIDIMFITGAYCIFKQKYDYIKYLWNYRQPQDSDANWIGHDIVPNSIIALINCYFDKDSFQGRSNLIWDNHHGSQLYFKQYFLLLLIREFQKVKVNSRHLLIDNFKLPYFFDSYSLSNIKFYVDDLVETAQGLIKQQDVLGNIGFDISRLEDDINSGLIPFLTNLKPLIDLQLENLIISQKISPIKINKFKQEFIEAFTNSTVVRNIISSLGLYEDKINDNQILKDPFVIKDVIGKEVFFEEWYSHSPNLGGEYGRNLAIQEDSYFISEIEKLCREVDINQFDVTLNLLEDNLQNIIIIATNFALDIFITNNQNFITESRSASQISKVRGLKGYYTYRDYDIPIFEAYCNNGRNDSKILILDKSKLGTLTQYSPIADRNSVNLTDIFYIDIQCFSENEDLMNDILQNPPDSLTQKGEQIKQKKYLEKRVCIKILWSFSFEIHQDFNGFLIKVSNTDIDVSNLEDFV